MIKFCKSGKAWGTNYSYNNPNYKTILSLRKIGKNNPNYKNGESRTYYKNRCKYLSKILPLNCSLCNSTKKLVTHHVDGNYKNNILENITIVCRGCHNKIHKTKTKKEGNK